MCTKGTRAGGLGITISSLLLWMLALPSWEFSCISPSNPMGSMGLNGGVWKAVTTARWPSVRRLPGYLPKAAQSNEIYFRGILHLCSYFIVNVIFQFLLRTSDPAFVNVMFHYVQCDLLLNYFNYSFKILIVLLINNSFHFSIIWS